MRFHFWTRWRRRRLIIIMAESYSGHEVAPALRADAAALRAVMEGVDASQAKLNALIAVARHIQTLMLGTRRGPACSIPGLPGAYDDALDALQAARLFIDRHVALGPYRTAHIAWCEELFPFGTT